ncbi:MAG TPA: rhomboid family intramembrane serine protease [Flavipsychrobacter sp.]
MTFGIPPKYLKEYPANDISTEEFVALVAETAEQLGWEIGFISHSLLIMYAGSGGFSNNHEVRITLDNTIATVKSTSVGNELFDWGRNRKQVKTFLAKYEEVKTSSTKELLLEKYETLRPEIADDEKARLLETGLKGGAFSMFIPQSGFAVTPVLLNINILVFILMAIAGVGVIAPDSEGLLNWGANFKPYTLDGQWWRILTSCFVHIGIFHLLMNMYALVYIGLLLEPILGGKRYAVAYLLMGIVASTTSLFWHDMSISAGASGAIFGLYGIFLALLTTNIIEKAARKSLMTSMLVFVGYNLLNGMKEGIDNAAHIGGLVSGVAIGYAFVPGLKKPDLKWLVSSTLAVVSAIVLVFSVVAVKTMPNDIGKYQAAMMEFAEIEEQALQVYNLPDDAPTEKLLEAVTQGLDLWKECIALLEEQDNLDIPTELTLRHISLKEYCELRLQSYSYIYKALKEDTDQYQSQIIECNTKIENILSELSAE